MRLYIRAVIGRAYPRILGMNREPSWILFDVVLPLLSMASFVYLYKMLDAPRHFTGFVVLGAALLAFWLNVLWSMVTQLHWDKESGNLALYMITPAPTIAILLGLALGSVYTATLRAIAIVAVGILLFGVNYRLDNLPLTAGIFVATLAALCALGVLLSAPLMLGGRAAWHLISLLQEPIYLVSGLYSPMKSFGVWITALASIVPLTLGVDAMRQLLFEADLAFGFLPPVVELVLLAVLAGAFSFLACRALQVAEEMSRKGGKLTLRGE